jgi:LysM repeat protein
LQRGRGLSRLRRRGDIARAIGASVATAALASVIGWQTADYVHEGNRWLLGNAWTEAQVRATDWLEERASEAWSTWIAPAPAAEPVTTSAPVADDTAPIARTEAIPFLGTPSPALAGDAASDGPEAQPTGVVIAPILDSATPVPEGGVTAAAQEAAAPAVVATTVVAPMVAPRPTPAPATPLRAIAPAPSAAPAATAAAPVVHVVESGETLYAIATRFDTTVAAIVRANKLADPDHIAVGDRLTIPR